MVPEERGRGHAGAQAYLCILYAHGAGVPRDFVEAANWYWKSRQTDPAAAQFALDSISADEGGEQGSLDVAKVFRAARPSQPFPDFPLSLLCSSF
jgi:TPR repeat protein